MSDTIGLSLWIYALAAAVALLIAGLIKGLVWALNRWTPAGAQRQTPAAAAATPAPQPPAPATAGIPPAHVAAITAALQAVLGEHRIVHIDDGSVASGWSAQGRAAHHRSHAAPPRGSGRR